MREEKRLSKTAFVLYPVHALWHTNTKLRVRLKGHVIRDDVKLA